MALNFHEPEDRELRAHITVFGVGGAGGNAVNNMIDKQLQGVEFIAANTDSQALKHSKANHKIQLGAGVTKGLGAGSKSEVGHSAAKESLEEIMGCLDGSHMCFITAGMGGGTGTGAAPVIACAAREMGILTVGVVTKPFQFEGARRMKLAETGVNEMQKVVDTLIVIPNQNLFQIASEKTTFVEAFVMADDVLYQGVQGVTDLMVRPGMINLDFADVRSVMEEMGKAMMGTGEAEGETRAIDATEKAIANPLLDEVSLKGAKGVLINITGGHDLTLFEMDEASNRIKDEVDKDALIKFGSAIDPEMEGKMRVSVVATGIDAEAVREGRPVLASDHHKPLETGRELVTAVRNARPADAVSSGIEKSSRKVESDVETAAETRTPDRPSEEIENRAATAPSPHDIRIRAAQVRNRAEEARFKRHEVDEESAFPQTVDGTEPALFDIDTESLAAPKTDEPVEDVPALVAERHPETSLHPQRPDLPPRHQTAFTSEPPLGQSAEQTEAQTRQSFFAIRNLIHRVAGGPQQDRRIADHPDDSSDDGREGDIPAFLRRQAN